jgi:limonene-1,2-epoxide hydrolase
MSSNKTRRHLLVSGTALSLAASATAASAKQAAPAASKNVELVRAFAKAGQELDLDKQMAFIAENAVYHNMPDEPVKGAKAIRELLAGYAKAEKAEIIIHRIVEASDGTVLTERLDRFMMGGKWIDCPVMGSCDIKDGKIVEWRDYYDNLKLRAQMA